MSGHSIGDVHMPSAFPGMDPFIEACGLWEDFHSKLIAAIDNALSAVVPEKYTVRLGERCYIALFGAQGKDFKPFLPDVGLMAPTQGLLAKASSTAVAEAAETGAVSMEAFVAMEFRETFIEIHEHDPEKRLVTCIEILSPSNKRRGSKGRKLYLRKRQALLLGAANLVELDLLRGGQRMPMLTPWPNSPYVLLVSREQRAPHCTVWPAHFQRPLPPIPIPLASPDADLQLDLQPLVATVYARSRYVRDLDYSHPPLTDDESAWLAEQLRARSPAPE
jgi:hypothetical protein